MSSLVEALVGLALVAGPCLAVVGLTSSTTRAAAAGQERTLARLELCEKMSAVELAQGDAPAGRREPAGDGLERVTFSAKLSDGSTVTLARLVRAPVQP